MKRKIEIASLLLVVCLLLGLAAPTFALDTRTLAAVNKPGVVLLQTMWTADIILYEIAFDASLDDDLLAVVEDMVIEGEIAQTSEAIYSTYLQLMIMYMGDYVFRTGNVQTIPANTGAVGTGFIVTPDGYLVTNAHVVATEEEELYLNFAKMALEELSMQSANDLLTDLRREGYEPSQDEIDSYMNQMYVIFSQNMELDNLNTQYYGYLGNVTPGSDISAKGVPLDLRKMGEPIPGKDIAVLKMDKKNLPTVALGDDSKLKTGDQVYAMGYPAVATLSEVLNVAQAIQEPTLTSGIISARKQMAGGWSILQTDADIHGGNSGGPLFNAEGEVVGVNTFGMLDQSGASASGMNFAVPISLVVQFLNEINVKPEESQFTMNFKKAQAFFDEGKYHEALEILRGLNETNPGFPVVADLLAEARLMADTIPASDSIEPAESSAPDTDGSGEAFGKNNADASSFPWLLVGIGGAVVIIAVLVIVILAGKNRKQRTAGQAQPMPQAFAPQQGASVVPQQAPVFTPQPSAPAHDAGVSQQPEPANQAVCPNCGADTPPGKRFCAECGTPLAKTCPGCGASLDANAHFCPECGAKV